jgi:hypothetical protein
MGDSGGGGGLGGGGGFYMYGAGEIESLHGGDEQHPGELMGTVAGGGAGGRQHHHHHHTASVRSDGNDIPQSRAVETVRETLAGAGGLTSGGRTGTGILSSSPGRGGIGLERERRKSVKFVATEERR